MTKGKALRNTDRRTERAIQKNTKEQNTRASSIGNPNSEAFNES